MQKDNFHNQNISSEHPSKTDMDNKPSSINNKNEDKNISKDKFSEIESTINLNLHLEKNNPELQRNIKIIDELKKPETNFNENINENLIMDYLSKINENSILEQDPWLKEFSYQITERVDSFKNLVKSLDQNEGFYKFVRSYKEMGFIIKENGIFFKEYAPAAKSLSIFGDFNGWNRDQYFCEKDQFGFWTYFFANRKDGSTAIDHNSKVKINLQLPNGNREDRNPVWIRYLVQNTNTFIYDSVFWNPSQPYKLKNPRPNKPKSLRIYEAHVGMSSAEPQVASYRHFADNVLPRIKETGYTAVQLMAIMEHAYYGSFGYHVTNFFAISSRSGTPDDFKYLIDKAHGLGIFVLIDLIHSHASSNTLDGLNYFDGTDYLYFHGGEKGLHKQWDSRIFNYGSYETQRFLLSNISMYMEEYLIDGFRFDGVTSMLYLHHGVNHAFTEGYLEYFNHNVDKEAGVYLMLANYLIHSIYPDALSIAEDVSGMPTLCRPIHEGGFGFDYRLNMSIPDKWIEYLKELKDEEWNMGNIVFTLTNRRYMEKNIAYSESHDQSIVGDKSISMWLFDKVKKRYKFKEIYENMSLLQEPTIRIDRGMSLHMMIRLITYSLGGEGYLNFIGNEFGHPEWVDFPREGNKFSYHHCRRRWDLGDSTHLRYSLLLSFDREMHKLESNVGWLNSNNHYIYFHENDKLIVYEKGDLHFIFNFHSQNSYDNYRVGTKWSSDHIILLDTDDVKFGGKGRVKYGRNNFFPIQKEKWNNRNNYYQMYIPCRTAIVLIAKENMKRYNLNEYFSKEILDKIKDEK